MDRQQTEGRGRERFDEILVGTRIAGNRQVVFLGYELQVPGDHVLLILLARSYTVVPHALLPLKYPLILVSETCLSPWGGSVTMSTLPMTHTVISPSRMLIEAHTSGGEFIY